MSFSLGGNYQQKSGGHKFVREGSHGAENEGSERKFRGGFRGRSSFRGVQRGRGSFRGVQRGRGSFRGEHRGRGSFRGEHRGRGSFRGEHRGRGSFRGEHRGRGSIRGEHSGRGSFHGEQKGRKANDSLQGKMMRLGFIAVFPKDNRFNLLKTCVREDKNYEKFKHLFEDLRRDSFPNKLKTFDNLSLPEAIKLISIGFGRGTPEEHGRNLETLKKVVKNLPPPTLREAINDAKYKVFNSCEKGIFNGIKDRRFPAKVPRFRMLALKEMKDLSGAEPNYYSSYVVRILSPTGRCIVNARFLDYFYNAIGRAADYIVEHPEVCKNISLGTIEL